ncbi:MAG TPA: flagellar brake protein [Novimethylophilus sp.]|jgi:c-di-GMP-binding flagellar brake protein YcgR|uniref:flagellar brake protein n=1 Tax=Novimethylophilus sp. TaxID=2137426 RepID=UPI002F3F4C74
MNDSDVKFELSSTPDDSRFLVHSNLEIVRTFRGLISRNEMVSAFFNAGNELLLTSVLAVDPDANTVMLDYGSNPAVNQRILKSEKIIFVTTLDSVKVQWVSSHIESDAFEGRDAFRIAIPQQILRLQRREYYRLTTPVINPLKCKIPTAEGMTVDITIADISAGGIGIVIAQPLGVAFEVGATFPGCRVELPGVGTAEFTLAIQSTWEVTMKNGNKSLRAGCQFVDMRPGIQALIQRYIIKLERERIANAPGH